MPVSTGRLICYAENPLPSFSSLSISTRRCWLLCLLLRNLPIPLLPLQSTLLVSSILHYLPLRFIFSHRLSKSLQTLCLLLKVLHIDDGPWSRRFSTQASRIDSKA